MTPRALTSGICLHSALLHSALTNDVIVDRRRLRRAECSNGSGREGCPRRSCSRRARRSADVPRRSSIPRPVSGSTTASTCSPARIARRFASCAASARSRMSTCNPGLLLTSSTGTDARLVWPARRFRAPLHLLVGALRWNAIGWRDRLALARLRHGGRRDAQSTRDGSPVAGMARPDAASHRAAVGAARGRGAEPVDRRSRGRDVRRGPPADIHLRADGFFAWLGSLVRSTSCTRFPRMAYLERSGGEVRTNSPARIQVESGASVHVRQEVHRPRAVICARGLAFLAGTCSRIVPARSGRRHSGGRIDGGVADRDGQFVVRSSRHVEHVRRTARSRDAMGVRQACAVWGGDVPLVARLEWSRGAGQRAIRNWWTLRSMS